MRKISHQNQENVSLGAVQCVERALDLLECLAQSSDWVGISTLSNATGQPAGTIHRLLMTLVARKYVVRDSATRRYALGPALRMLASASSQMPDWTTIGTPLLQELVEISGESVNMVVMERNQAVFVAQAQPTRMVRMFTELGKRLPLHCTAGGKVLLAHQPDSVIASVIAETGLPALTDKTIVDPSQFQQELEMVRQQGYATDNGEQEEGLRCVAMPVYDAQGRVVAAVSISGPSSRLDSRRTPTLLPQLRRICAALSSALAASQENMTGSRQAMGE